MTDFAVVGAHPYIMLQIICCSFKKAGGGGSCKDISILQQAFPRIGFRMSEHNTLASLEIFCCMQGFQLLVLSGGAFRYTRCCCLK